MDTDSLIRSAIIGGVAGGLAVLFIALFGPKRQCPECEEPMPRARKPANRRQMLWGGWTCPKCGCEMDRRGRKISAPDTESEPE